MSNYNLTQALARIQIIDSTKPSRVSALKKFLTSLAYGGIFDEVAGSPVGVTTPTFKGHMVLDTVNGHFYKANGLTNTSWSLIGASQANVGTAGTGFTAVETGDGYHRRTVLTAATAFGAIAGGAALGLGKQAYTFPAGAIVVNAAHISLALTQTQGNVNANTPVVGLGTVVASGAVNVLSGTGTFQNVLAGTAAANCTGTATVNQGIPTANVPLVIPAASAHTLFVNIAATWSAGGDAALGLTGTVTIDWTFLK